MSNIIVSSEIGEATDVDTSPQRLEELAKHRSSSVRRAVAANPNTPYVTLETLACEFPHQFLANPQIMLLQIAQPNFIDKIPFKVWAHLMRCEETPTLWLKAVLQKNESANHIWFKERLKLLLSEHVSLGGEGVVDGESENKRDIYTSYSSMTYIMRKNLILGLVFSTCRVGIDWNKCIENLAERDKVELLLHYAGLNERTLAILAEDRNLRIQAHVARYRNVPELVLARLMESKESVRRAVAGSPHLPVRYVSALVRDEAVRVRRAVAVHPLLEQRDVELLAKDTEVSVRAAVATRGGLGDEVLELLVSDAEVRVRAALAGNARVEAEVLSRLAQDPEQAVRVAVASNPRLPKQLFGVLEQDCEEVRASLAGNAQLPKELFGQLREDPSRIVLQGLARNQRIPEDILESLYTKELVELHKDIAHNRQATPDLLVHMSNSNSVDVLAVIASNKRTPVDILWRLVNKQSQSIWHSLSVNPCTPLEVMERILEIAMVERMYVFEELFIRIANHPAVMRDGRSIIYRYFLFILQQSIMNLEHGDIVSLLAQQEDISQRLLSILAGSGNHYIRMMVVKHPRVTKRVLLKLSYDGHRQVRKAAYAQLGKELDIERVVTESKVVKPVIAVDPPTGGVKGFFKKLFGMK